MRWRIGLAVLAIAFLAPGRTNPETPRRLTVAFWNTRNLFDTEDDPRTRDEDFTPNGKYHWTEEKLEKKIQALARIIREIDADIVGLAEVENIHVLKRLGTEAGYQHAYLIERNDIRGIDTGILSNTPLGDVHNTGPGRGYIRASIGGVWIAFTHWKSRIGSVERTEAMRIRQARHATTLPEPLLILGDFNEPGEFKARSSLIESGFVDLISRTDCVSFFQNARGSCIDGAYTKASTCSLNARAEIVRPASMMKGNRPDQLVSDHFPVRANIQLCKTESD